MSSPVLRWTTIGAVLLLAAIAAVVSYSHMFELALRHGEPEWRAALFPLSVDGMVVAASMTLLADARQGRRGGVLPWSLLILGSFASLAANVAVADPTVWSRIIHAWPSVALIGSYELLMRQFRGAACVRDAHAVRTQPGKDQVVDDRAAGGLNAEPEDVPDRPDLRVVHERGWSSSQESVATDNSPPPALQRDAWTWALANRREDGSLPTGEEVADRFERKPRWGRLVKQRGEKGLLTGSNGRADENAEDQVVKSGVPVAGAVV